MNKKQLEKLKEIILNNQEIANTLALLSIEAFDSDNQTLLFEQISRICSIHNISRSDELVIPGGIIIKYKSAEMISINMVCPSLITKDKRNFCLSIDELEERPEMLFNFLKYKPKLELPHGDIEYFNTVLFIQNLWKKCKEKFTDEDKLLFSLEYTHLNLDI